MGMIGSTWNLDVAGVSKMTSGWKEDFIMVVERECLGSGGSLGALDVLAVSGAIICNVPKVKLELVEGQRKIC